MADPNPLPDVVDVPADLGGVIDRIKAIGPSWVRTTIAPPLGAWLLAHLPGWLGLTNDQVNSLSLWIALGLWYGGWRLVETYRPKIGRWVIGLGRFSAPDYQGKHAA